MLFGSQPQRRPAVDRETIAHSLAAAARAGRRSLLEPDPEEAAAATRAILRAPYEAALAAGTLAPAPEDFTGWRIGAITVLGPTDTPGRWGVHNPSPPPGVAPHYTVCEASLLASYAAGDLVPPDLA